MFYFLMKAITAYHWILILAAVIPAAVLMVKVYKSDYIEKESTAILWRLVRAGILSALLALVEETIGQAILTRFIPQDDKRFDIIMFFVVVAVSEESSKYIFMKRESWNDPEFNCLYDGVVYAVFTSLGFALWENIQYVLSYGFSTALVRAVTAIPGHASFGVFMGVFYGLAKKSDVAGEKGKCILFKVLAFLAPVLMHGSYDYLATRSEDLGQGPFFAFVVVLFILAYVIVHFTAKKDHYLDGSLTGRQAPRTDNVVWTDKEHSDRQ